MEELTFIKLEDGRECFILDEFKYEENNYVVLMNSKDKDDYVIRKQKDNLLIGLKDKEELSNVLKYYLSYKTKELNRNE